MASDKQERINQINKALGKKRGYDSDTSSMTYDGIVGPESNYSGTTFVLKETPDRDFASEIANPNGIKPGNPFSYNLNKIKYSIDQATKGEEYNDETAEKISRDPITGIGYVNIKKKAEGHYKTPDADVREYAKKDGQYIKAEIKILEPKVIYCGGKGTVYNSVRDLYPEFDGKEIYNKNDIHIFDRDGRKLIVIDGYHPSGRVYIDPKAIHTALSQPEVQEHLNAIKNQTGSAFQGIKSDYEKESFNTPIIGIIIGVIVVIAIILLLLRNCGSGSRPAARISASSSEQSQSPVISDVIRPEPEPPLVLPGLTFDTIHFVKDTRFFLSEGNYYTNLPPDMTEGKYEDRLNTIASDIKRILAVSPDQIFIISGHAADIPGFEQGEMDLSAQRAERVKDVLITLGVPINNLQCVYSGGTDKWGDNLTEETRKQNRTVTIELKK